eukprot:jgi/Ulvmu1/6213/UM028_0069.1
MFKRRDWVYTHNPDTGDVTSESGSEENSEVGSSEPESEAESQGAGEVSASASENEQPEVPQVRMEDLQDMMDSDESIEGDDDSDGNTDQDKLVVGEAASRTHIARSVDPAAVEEQKAAWLQASQGTSIKGTPLRCLLCKNKLLVNSSGFQAHMKSKAHLAASKRHGLLHDPMEQLDNIVAASSQRHQVEETETHRERVERFREIAEGLNLKKQQGATSAVRKPRKRRKKCAQGCQQAEVAKEGSDPRTNHPSTVKKSCMPSSQTSSKKPKRKKPGKRQRLEAKATAAAGV